MSQPDSDTADTAPPTRAGHVAVVGAPNAGKSTLVNRLVGQKISIVTPKVQTTRARITAIAVWGPSQVVFVDTPGIFRQAKKRLERAMVQAAWGGAEDADLVLLMVDAKRRRVADTDAIIAGLKRTGARAILVLNKIDTVPRASLLELAAAYDGEGVFERIFMISALNGDGVADLETHLAAAMPEGPWLYPEDQLAVIPERLLAAEIMRERLFLEMRQELPYALTVETEAWKNFRDGSVRIEQVVYVARDGHKGIILGKRGETAKRIGALAREEMQRVFERKVHLFFFVKVRPDWADDPERYREMGLDYPR